MEEDDLEINFQEEPLSLKKFGVIAVASNPDIWNLHLNVITKPIIEALKKGWIKSNIWDIYQPSFLHELKLKTLKIISQQSTLQNSLQDLPNALAMDIQFKILELCDLIYDWIIFLRKDLKLPSKYADKIYFTSKGTIDVVRIFRSYWSQIPDIPHRRWFYQKFKIKYWLACLFDVESLVHCQTDVINEILLINPGFQMNHNADPTFQIMSIVIHAYKIFVDYESIELNQPNLTAIVMLEVCKDLGFYKPFVYFYNHLDAVEEQNFLENISQLLWSGFNKVIFSMKLVKYWKENVFQINMFLLKKMNSSQKVNFVLNNFQPLFLHFLGKESCQNFSVFLLDRFLQPYVLEKEDEIFYFILLETLLKLLLQNKDFGIATKFHEQIFQLAMRKIPKNNKIEIFKGASFILDVYYSSSTPVLRMVFNDQDFKEMKNLTFGTVKIKFELLLERKDHDALNEFMASFLNSKDLADEFEEVISYILESWIINYQFVELNSYLTWRHGTSASDCKTQMYAFWCSLVPKTFPNIQRLLLWFFGKEEMPTVKNCLTDHELKFLKQFCQELIYNIWFRSKTLVLGNNLNININDTIPSIDLSTQILVSCFISEEEIDIFKKTELVKDESCVRFFCECAIKNYDDPEVQYEYRFETVDEFFEFCSLPTDKLETIKEVIANNIEEWIGEYGVNKNRLEVVVPLLDWIYGKRTENREILVNCFQNREKVIAYYESKEK